MDHLACKHHFSRVIPLLACCSLAWLAYSRYTVKQQPTQRALPVSKSVTDSDELPARATLDKLSLDILLEIMEYLEWHELLKLRQVRTIAAFHLAPLPKFEHFDRCPSR